MDGNEGAAAGGWRGARADLAGGLGRAFMWTSLGWLDVRQRYSGSVLGSLWLTANMVLMVGCLTLIFAVPLGSRPGPYAAYVTIGLVLWSFIQTTAAEAPAAFVNAAEPLRQCVLPASLHVFRLLWRNLIVLAHSAVLVPIVLLIFGIRPAASAWTAAPAFLLLVLALFFAVLLLALLGARFRDVSQIVTNGLQLLFFATPVFWLPAALPHGRLWLLRPNPLFAFLDIVRAPLLGGAPAAASWPIAAGTTLALAVAASAAYAAWRQRIVYWI
ncbi:MAG TPA: ABC transporter permease [Allosphingosinicella sp.]|nr:ABC transporter permease [Allosphingosinicella sp.]